jgi:hypothetical protein
MSINQHTLVVSIFVTLGLQLKLQLPQLNSMRFYLSNKGIAKGGWE